METSKERLEREYRDNINKAVKRFRKEAGFTEDEVLTEEKIKYKEYKLKNIALHESIASNVLREAILKN